MARSVDPPPSSFGLWLLSYSARTHNVKWVAGNDFVPALITQAADSGALCPMKTIPLINGRPYSPLPPHHPPVPAIIFPGPFSAQ